MKTIKLLTILALMLLTSVTAHAQNSLVGDVNKDGRVNITDAMLVVDIILHGQKELSLSVTEISLDKGNSATIVITSGYGSYTVSSTDTNIADATLVGSTVIITGKNGGTTVVKVIDTISGNIEEISVTVNDDTPISYPACPDGNHPHLIDLGLPSGTKWACCNVGADKPEAYGGYYAWGETEEKDVYDYLTYIHCDGSHYTVHNIGDDISGTEYDVAHVKWGGLWQMPTIEQCIELYYYCTLKTNISMNGVIGEQFINRNGGSIFIPAAGYRWDDELKNVEKSCVLWSSTRYDKDGSQRWAYPFGSSKNSFTDRGQGRSVRPVVRN